MTQFTRRRPGRSAQQETPWQELVICGSEAFSFAAGQTGHFQWLGHEVDLQEHLCVPHNIRGSLSSFLVSPLLSESASTPGLYCFYPGGVTAQACPSVRRVYKIFDSLLR